MNYNTIYTICLMVDEIKFEINYIEAVINYQIKSD